MTGKWSVESWRELPIQQQPIYEDAEEVKAIESKIKSYPPLVFAGEASNLKTALGRVSKGEAFLLQGGVCAESFLEFHPDNIRDTFRVLLQKLELPPFVAKLEKCHVYCRGEILENFRHKLLLAKERPPLWKLFLRLFLDCLLHQQKPTVDTILF
jgi:hypothetical protein